MRRIFLALCCLVLAGLSLGLKPDPATAQWFTESNWFFGPKEKDAKPADKKKVAKKKVADKNKATEKKQPATAQKAKPKPKPKTSKAPSKKGAQQMSAAKVPELPDPRRMHILIVSSIIAAHHANKTGNYSVLWTLAAPSFQQNNSLAALKKIFANLRNRKLDFSPIILYAPKLLRQPTIDQHGLLRLTGFFDTRPERVLYDLAFRKIGDDWKLFGISLNTRPAKIAAKTQKTAPKKPAASAAKAKSVVKKK